MAHILRQRQISRRTMLRGAGAAVSLPLLDMMSRPQADASEPEADQLPRRMAVLWMPNGVHPKLWTPKGVGRQFELSQTLSPLKEHQDDLLVLTNLWHQNCDTGDGHYVKCSGFLTGTTIHKTVGADLNSNGISVDQLIASNTGRQTPLPSLELGTEPVRTGVDKAVGYTRVYGAHIAWKTPTIPLAKEVNPRLAFDRIYQVSQRGGTAALRDSSMLDQVMADAKRLSGRLGQSDRRKLDEYLESVRDVEQRLQRLSSTDVSSWRPRVKLNPADRPAAVPTEHAEKVRLMLDVIALAFQTDTTRVCTFMFGNSVSDISFSFLDGVDGAHHSLSHHENDEDKMRQYQLINQWHVMQYRYLIQRLKAMPEGESTVFDHSMLMLGSGLRDGQSHDPHNLPVVLAGGCGGRIETGQHLEFEKDSPLSNLYLSMLAAMGVQRDRFADSTGHLAGVLSQPPA